MIYELLLIQEGGMSIPSDIFARRDYRRTGFLPYECLICGLVFLSNDGCKQHLTSHHRSENCWDRLPCLPLLPAVSISLLRTCRIVRSEASPILYSRNSFHFSDSATASNFRWGTDCAQAGAIQDLGIKFGERITPWLTYLTKRTHSLCQDFPHLRRMTITLGTLGPWIRLESATVLRSMSEKLGETYQGLEWVLVLMLTDENVLDDFEPSVDRKDDFKNGKKAVQRHVWANLVGDGWKNALLWWGFPGEAVPQKYRVIGDQPQQQVSSELDGQGELHAAEN